MYTIIFKDFLKETEFSILKEVKTIEEVHVELDRLSIVYECEVLGYYDETGAGKIWYSTECLTCNEVAVLQLPTGCFCKKCAIKELSDSKMYMTRLMKGSFVQESYKSHDGSKNYIKPQKRSRRRIEPVRTTWMDRQGNTFIS